MFSHACGMLFNLPNCLGVGARYIHSTPKETETQLGESEDLPELQWLGNGSAARLAGCSRQEGWGCLGVLLGLVMLKTTDERFSEFKSP